MSGIVDYSNALDNNKNCVCDQELHITTTSHHIHEITSLHTPPFSFIFFLFAVFIKGILQKQPSVHSACSYRSAQPSERHKQKNYEKIIFLKALIFKVVSSVVPFYSPLPSFSSPALFSVVSLFLLQHYPCCRNCQGTGSLRSHSPFSPPQLW